ncbi:MAG TPA: S8 family serine peptidase, partial [Acidimicrobiia bacterium]|nr:S8 family serine peptidase [Acidimicrobiia bacterium]
MANGDANEATEDVGGERVRRIRSVSLDIVDVEDVDAALDEYLEQPGVRYVEVDHAASALSNDPLWANQWNMQPVSASNKGTANVEPAWARSRGDGVVVAVVDTGVRTGGSDLDASRVLAGKDFVNADDDATDDNGHGTHVAGTIAQSTDNDRGVAGVAPGAKILPVKVLDAT